MKPNKSSNYCLTTSYTDRMFHEGRAPVLLCGAEIRRAIKLLSKRTIPRLAVVSVNEIPERIDLSSYDVVKIDA